MYGSNEKTHTFGAKIRITNGGEGHHGDIRYNVHIDNLTPKTAWSLEALQVMTDQFHENYYSKEDISFPADFDLKAFEEDIDREYEFDGEAEATFSESYTEDGTEYDAYFSLNLTKLAKQQPIREYSPMGEGVRLYVSHKDDYLTVKDMGNGRLWVQSGHVCLSRTRIFSLFEFNKMIHEGLDKEYERANGT